MAKETRRFSIPAAILALAAALAAPPTALAQEDSGLPKSGKLQDDATTSAGCANGDAREFRAECTGSKVQCVLVMQKPLLEGMFTCAHVAIDCDDNQDTGLGGYELLIRAAVGSRFQATAEPPTNGKMKAIEHLRSSKSTVEDDGRGGHRWLHSSLSAAPPVVEGNELRFAFPTSLVRERGDRYHGRFAIRVQVVTSCADQPLEVVHVASDEGVPIRMDGDDGDWSAPSVEDPGEELHPDARCVDLTRLRVEHSASRLLACVNLAEARFASWEQDHDVPGRATVHLVVEPLFPTYQSAIRADIIGGLSQSEGRVPEGAWLSVSSGRTIEVSFPRVVGQTRFRVIVHSEVNWVDSFGGRLRLDAGDSK